MRIQNYRFKCRTCKQFIPLEEISTHDPTHRIMVVEKLKPFLLGVALSMSISAIVFGILMYTAIIPEINELLEVCRGMIST